MSGSLSEIPRELRSQHMMAVIEDFCKDISKYYPDVNDFYGCFMANCALNGILSLFAVIGNTTIICAFKNTTCSLSASKLLLLGLAMSDLGVGLVVQPLYIAVIAEMFQEGSVSPASRCKTKIAFLVVGCFLAGASFFTVSAISFDRFLAVSLHLRYNEIVTEKKAVVTLILLWILSAIAAIGYLLLGDITREAVSTTFSVIFFVTTTMTFIRIYIAVRRHRLQISAQQRSAEENYKQVALNKRKYKSVINILYLCLVFTACYIPYCCATMIIASANHGQALKVFFHIALTLAFLNSSLNPIIFCWRMREIRVYVVEVGAKMLPCLGADQVNSRATQDLSMVKTSFCDRRRETSHV